MNPRAAATRSPTRPATSHCRALGAVPATGHSALPVPTRPRERVQMVSTQPELPVRCCTNQAPRHQDRERYGDGRQRFEIQNCHAKSRWTTNVSKYAQVKARFQREVPPLVSLNPGFLIFFLGRAVPYWPPKAAFSNG